MGTAHAQSDPATERVTELVSVRVLNAGFDNTYRPHRWFPLQVEVRNRAEAFTGVVAVRPEANGRAVSNAYSTPITLTADAQTTVTLLIQARATSAPLVIEILNTANERLASTQVRLTPLDGRDKVYMALGEVTALLPLIGDIAPVEARAVTARYTPDQFPENPAALEAVDALIVGELFGDSLSTAQAAALRQWVSSGGHVVWIGNATTQTLQASFGALLPVSVTGVQTRSDWQAVSVSANTFAPVPALGRVPALLAVATPQEGATVRLEQEGVPLLVRQTWGAGVADFWAFDPAGAPFAEWEGLPVLWRETFASVPVRGSWARGLIDPQAAVQAIVAMPNDDLFPPASTLVIFLLVYVGVVGVLNYAVLARLKRLEWAWVTIPVLVLGFSIVAFQVGFTLRGEEALISHLRAVMVPRESDSPARAIDLVGVLAPRRSILALEAPAGAMLHPLPTLGDTQDRFQSSAHIVQSGRTLAQDVAVEGGIFSPFYAQQPLAHPQIGGQVTLVSHDNGTQTVQGIVRNASPHPLTDVTLLARGVAVHVADRLEAGAVLVLRGQEVTLASQGGLPAPSRLENSATLLDGVWQRIDADTLLSVRGVMNTLAHLPRRERLRREALLASVMRDQYGSLARLDDVYLVGWSDAPLDDYTLTGYNTRTIPTTVYVVALSVEVASPPTGVTVTRTPEQFIWQMVSNEGVRGGINDLLFEPENTVTIDFVPIASASLTTVRTLELSFSRGSGYSGAIKLDIWNWQTKAWERQNENLRDFSFINPAPYIGTGGRVRTRWTMDYPVNSARVRDIRMSMTGQDENTP